MSQALYVAQELLNKKVALERVVIWMNIWWG